MADKIMFTGTWHEGAAKGYEEAIEDVMEILNSYSHYFKSEEDFEAITEEITDLI